MADETPSGVSDALSVRTYQSAGKLDLALPLHEQTLKLMRAKLGADHRETLGTMVGLEYLKMEDVAGNRQGVFALPVRARVVHLLIRIVVNGDDSADDGVALGIDDTPGRPRARTHPPGRGGGRGRPAGPFPFRPDAGRSPHHRVRTTTGAFVSRNGRSRAQHEHVFDRVEAHQTTRDVSALEAAVADLFPQDQPT